MRRWLVVGLGASGVACSLIVDTSGLSGGPIDDGRMSGADADASIGPPSDAPADTCTGAACLAPPLPPCDGPCPPVRITTEVDVRGIAADEKGVYWTAPEAGDIRRAKVDGTSIVTLYDGANAPSLLALDDAFVFWTEIGKGNVRSIGKTVDHGQLAAEVTGETGALTIAASNGYVFWQAKGSGNIRRATAALDGLFTVGNEGQDVPGIAADSTNVILAVAGNVNLVRSLPVAGAGIAQDVTPKVVEMRGLALDAARIYYISSGITPVVQSVAKSGGDLRSYGNAEKEPRCVAVDGPYVYWATYGDGLIRRAPKVGGTAETLATGQTKPFAIAVNSRAIYWLNEIGEVMMLRKP